MSLDFNVTRIEGHKVVTTHPADIGKEDPRWHPVTEALVAHSMICGFNNITAGNTEEVFRRIRIWETIAKPVLEGIEGHDLRIGRKDVVRHIGFRCNATPLSLAKFKAKVWNELVLIAAKETEGHSVTAILSKLVAKHASS